jgi:very-short-patch-repair endonuclease
MPNRINKRKQRPHKYIYRECAYCKKLYKVYPSWLERSKYCSRACKDKDMLGKVVNKTGKQGRPAGSSNPNNKEIKICQECNNSFICYKSQKKNKYCSYECLKKAIKKGLFKGIGKGRIPWNKNKTGLQKHTEEFKNKQRINRLNYMATHNGPFRDTSIELIMKKALTDNGLLFRQSAKIGKYCVDFIVGNKVIECDGHYWHNRPGDKLRDFVRDCAIIDKGYSVLRFLDYNIENNINECINTIKTTK